MAFFHKGQDLSYKCVDNVYLKIYCGLKDDPPDDALFCTKWGVVSQLQCYRFQYLFIFRDIKVGRHFWGQKSLFEVIKTTCFSSIDKSFYLFPKKCGQNCHCCHWQFQNKRKGNEQPNKSMELGINSQKWNCLCTMYVGFYQITIKVIEIMLHMKIQKFRNILYLEHGANSVVE